MCDRVSSERQVFWEVEGGTLHTHQEQPLTLSTSSPLLSPPLPFSLTDDRDIVSQGLANGKKDHVLGEVRVHRTEGQSFAVEAVLREEKQRAHALAKLKHQTVVVVSREGEGDFKGRKEERKKERERVCV